MLKVNRRYFLESTGATVLGLATLPAGAKDILDFTSQPTISISRTSSNFEREPLKRPFGFKGSAMTNVWQTAVLLETSSGTKKIGLGTQNTLWSDPAVFTQYSEQGSNALMYALTEQALQLVRGKSFTNPINLLEETLPQVMEYGRYITQNNKLRTTFALNALVAVDNAVWLTYSAVNGIDNFDQMIPKSYRKGLSTRHDKVASIPALGYGTSMEEIKSLADAGHFIMKIKIGAPGDQNSMLEKDKAFLKDIHDTIGHYETPYSSNGKIPYYFDANGRYQKKETLLRFMDYAEKIGALDQIAVLEEPFGEVNTEDVSDITERSVFVAADESAHTEEDAIERIEQGYNTIVVKPAAKTLSMTLKIIKSAYERDIPCFCADLTVNPILVDWNKVVAARLCGLGELKIGLQETNGWQNYKNWDTMLSYHPTPKASWVNTKNGFYETDESFYNQSGGIFLNSSHYVKMFESLTD